jgi:ATP synthase protein I
MPPERSEQAKSHDEATVQRIDRDVDRKLRARAEGRRAVWFGLGMFGLVGWSVTVPSMLGLALGLWLDARFPGRVSWTLTFLFVGVGLGSLNAWYWVKQESQRR